MRRLAPALTAALLLGTAVSFAGADKVAFPSGYKEWRLYAMSDRPDNKTVRDIYANAVAVRAGQVARPLPSGSVLSMDVYQAKLDDKGDPLKGPDGRFVKGGLVGVFVMEKRAGWGAEYPDSLRNGEWEYARFAPNGTRQNVDTKPCFECHKPESAKDYVFTLDKLRWRGK
jgi:hypothetical protein